MGTVIIGRSVLKEINSKEENAVEELGKCLGSKSLQLEIDKMVDGKITVRIATAIKIEHQQIVVEKMPLLNNGKVIAAKEWKEKLRSIASEISQQLGHSVAALTAEESLMIVIPLTSRDGISSDTKKNALKLLDERLTWQKQQLIKLQALHGV